MYLNEPVSIIELSANALIGNEDNFLALRCYFDGAQKGDLLTLAAITASNVQWRNFEDQWRSVLEKHKAPMENGERFLHTTDALALQNEFSEQNGWTKPKVRALITDCVSVMTRCMARPKDKWFHGIFPFSVTVSLEDFRKALSENSELGTPEGACITSCLGLCFEWGNNYLSARRYNLVFDRKEKFRGHVVDRMDNKRSRRDNTIWDNIDGITEANARQHPSLQAADLVGWSVNTKREHGITHPWQKTLLESHKEDHYLTLERLRNPDLDAIKLVRSWNLPRRKKFK